MLMNIKVKSTIMQKNFEKELQSLVIKVCGGVFFKENLSRTGFFMCRFGILLEMVSSAELLRLTYL